eukprot:GHVQ01015836.1.p1 GENE.GHVQ01015836.1~~GHVQ01015836.1.p1  ORF type:complete len:1321 (-),score=195.00 GHVQ01015836.1:263-4225(-)
MVKITDMDTEAVADHSSGSSSAVHCSGSFTSCCVTAAKECASDPVSSCSPPQPAASSKPWVPASMETWDKFCRDIKDDPVPRAPTATEVAMEQLRASGVPVNNLQVNTEDFDEAGKIKPEGMKTLQQRIQSVTNKAKEENEKSYQQQEKDRPKDQIMWAYEVFDAGEKDANGVYNRDKAYSGFPMYVNDAGYAITKQEGTKGGMGWVLGKLEGNRPLYGVMTADASLPLVGWQKFQGDLPLPRIKYTLEQTKADQLKDAGNVEFKKGRMDRSRLLYTEALELTHVTKELKLPLLNNRSEVHLRLSQWADALKDAKDALSIQPNHPKGLLRAAKAARGCRMYDEGVEFLDSLLEVDSSNVEAKVLKEECQTLSKITESAGASGGARSRSSGASKSTTREPTPDRGVPDTSAAVSKRTQQQGTRHHDTNPGGQGQVTAASSEQGHTNKEDEVPKFGLAAFSGEEEETKVSQAAVSAKARSVAVSKQKRLNKNDANLKETVQVLEELTDAVDKVRKASDNESETVNSKDAKRRALLVQVKLLDLSRCLMNVGSTKVDREAQVYVRASGGLLLLVDLLHCKGVEACRAGAMNALRCAVAENVANCESVVAHGGDVTGYVLGVIRSSRDGPLLLCAIRLLRSIFGISQLPKSRLTSFYPFLLALHKTVITASNTGNTAFHKLTTVLNSRDSDTADVSICPQDWFDLKHEVVMLYRDLTKFLTETEIDIGIRVIPKPLAQTKKFAPPVVQSDETISDKLETVRPDDDEDDKNGSTGVAGRKRKDEDSRDHGDSVVIGAALKTLPQAQVARYKDILHAVEVQVAELLGQVQADTYLVMNDETKVSIWFDLYEWALDRSACASAIAKGVPTSFPALSLFIRKILAKQEELIGFTVGNMDAADQSVLYDDAEEDDEDSDDSGESPEAKAERSVCKKEMSGAETEPASETNEQSKDEAQANVKDEARQDGETDEVPRKKVMKFHYLPDMIKQHNVWIERALQVCARASTKIAPQDGPGDTSTDAAPLASSLVAASPLQALQTGIVELMRCDGWLVVMPLVHAPVNLALPCIQWIAAACRALPDMSEFVAGLGIFRTMLGLRFPPNQAVRSFIEDEFAKNADLREAVCSVLACVADTVGFQRALIHKVTDGADSVKCLCSMVKRTVKPSTRCILDVAKTLAHMIRRRSRRAQHLDVDIYESIFVPEWRGQPPGKSKDILMFLLTESMKSKRFRERVIASFQERDRLKLLSELFREIQMISDYRRLKAGKGSIPRDQIKDCTVSSDANITTTDSAGVGQEQETHSDAKVPSDIASSNEFVIDGDKKETSSDY